jgi:hypothetical protein
MHAHVPTLCAMGLMPIPVSRVALRGSLILSEGSDGKAPLDDRGGAAYPRSGMAGAQPDLST